MIEAPVSGKASDFEALLAEVRGCGACRDLLPLGPRPVFQISPTARILIASQAPGTKVHASGIPFSDPSGDRLREWMGISKARFYDPQDIAIVPMGLCYPGRGQSGDAPPRPECAPLWRERLIAAMRSAFDAVREVRSPDCSIRRTHRGSPDRLSADRSGRGAGSKPTVHSMPAGFRGFPARSWAIRTGAKLDRRQQA